MLSIRYCVLPPFSRYYLTASFLYLEVMSSEEITDLIINLQEKMAVVWGGKGGEREKEELLGYSYMSCNRLGAVLLPLR